MKTEPELHRVPFEVTPELKSVEIQHTSAEINIILTTFYYGRPME